MKIKINELHGVALDWAVAKCEELNLRRLSGGEFLLSNGDFWFPSLDWAQGGTIIERDKIDILFQEQDLWLAVGFGMNEAQGQTPLIAAMRCYVASKLGDEIEIPEELKECV